MADNTTLNTGSGGDVVRTKDRAGIKTNIAALDLNPAGTETLMAGTMPVSGTLTAVTTVTTLTGTTTLTPGTGATNLGKAGGGTWAGTDTGVSVLVDRNDGAATQQQATNARYTGLSADQQGRLYTVPASAKLTITSAGLDTVTTYADGDQMGTEVTVANGARYTGGSALIVGAIATSNAAATPGFPFDLYIFNAATTPASNNAAAAWSDADIAKLGGVISFPPMQFRTNNGFCQATLGAPVQIDAAATSVFVDLVARGAITVFTAATDVIIRLTVVYL